MIKNFEKVKGQLAELADLLNKFNSENVQLKLIELLFSTQERKETETLELPVIPVEKRRPGRPAKVAKTEVETKLRREPKALLQKQRIRKKTDRPGPSNILNLLLEKGFFSEKRTIGQIVKHCKEAYNYDYKSTDLSGTLAKMTKDGRLIREKNPVNNQFEYIQPS